MTADQAEEMIRLLRRQVALLEALIRPAEPDDSGPRMPYPARTLAARARAAATLVDPDELAAARARRQRGGR